MKRQEAEHLADMIRQEAPSHVTVLGIEPFGPNTNPSLATDFFVKCASRPIPLFAVKSPEHWQDLKQYVIARLSKTNA